MTKKKNGKSRASQVLKSTKGMPAAKRKRRATIRELPTKGDMSSPLPQLHAELALQFRYYSAIQAVRKGMMNQLGAMERRGFPTDIIVGLAPPTEMVQAREAFHGRLLEKLAQRHPMWKWAKEIAGVGPKILGEIIGVFGTLRRYPTVSKMWAYGGMKVVNGEAPRRVRGERGGWNPQARVVVFLLGEAFVKQGDHYRQLYLTKKAGYAARPLTGPSQCPFGAIHRSKSGVIECSNGGAGHRHAAARRYAAKQFLKDMWKEWRVRIAPEDDPLPEGHYTNDDHTGLADGADRKNGSADHRRDDDQSSRVRTPVIPREDLQ